MAGEVEAERARSADGEQLGAGSVADIGPTGPPSRLRRLARCLLAKAQVWRSPHDEPRWIRPALLVIGAVAGFAYGWRLSNQPLEPYYGAAVRSMGTSWHDFAFGAVDPAGTVTLDKLPGAFWVQALFVRAFGFHYWAVALPQVLAGVITVFVLFRAVRRLAGSKAALVAAAITAATPATVLVNRGNVSDSILILLLVLAADAATKALLTGRQGSLLLAGAWVGLAFQAKMVQAWLVLPALFAAYLVAAPPPLRRRLAHVGAAGVLCLVVSLSWMSAVSLVPREHRPYVDGTMDDSVFTQVFIYNGSTRMGIHAGRDRAALGVHPFLIASSRKALAEIGPYREGRHADRLITGPIGRSIGWLLPAAVVAMVGVLVARWRAPRSDPLRAVVILWGTWLVTLSAFFSAGTFVQPYYVAVLTPAIAALCAVGLVVAWRAAATARVPTVVVAVVLGLTVAHAVMLVPDDAWGGIRGAVAVVVLAVIAEAALLGSLVRRSPTGSPVVRRRPLGWALAAVVLVLLPAVTVGVAVHDGLGSFSTPYQSNAATRILVDGPRSYQAKAPKVAASYRRYAAHHAIIEAVDSGSLAADQIMMTGLEFLPIGGFRGANPSPTLSRLRDLIRHERVAWFMVGVEPPSDDPRIEWIREHCLSGPARPYGQARVRLYHCLPDAA